MLEQLWQEHLSKPFPKGYGGKDFDGIDLVLLDGDIAGCVSTFLKNGGELDLLRTAILGLCYHDSVIAGGHLTGEAHEYFCGLETISKLVLESIVSKNKRSA